MILAVTTWLQNYNPLGRSMASTLVAALPVVVLLGTLAFLRVKAHWSAVLGLGSALLIATAVFHMPVHMAAAAGVFGACYGLLPIGWIILNVIFLYMMTEQRGLFRIVKESLTSVTQDSRLQLVLIAYCLGAFFEGAAGFGAPVAVCAAMLIGLGFSPLAASSFALLTNTAPCAFAALGIPVITLQKVTGLDLQSLSATVGLQLSIFSLIIPFWLVWAFAGFRGMVEVWPALLVAGAGFAIPQYLLSTYHGPWLVNIGASLISMAALTLLLFVWHPRRVWGLNGHEEGKSARGFHEFTRGQVFKAWLPWIILSLLVFVWALQPVKGFLDRHSAVEIAVAGLDKCVVRTPPVVPAEKMEAATFNLNWLSTTGTSILVAAIISGFAMGYSLREMAATYWATIKKVRFSLITVAAMMSLGFVTRYSGLDATMGMAFSKTGVLYPFFGTLLGWIGVAITGSDTAANVLFGSMQCISAQQLGLSPVLMASANSSGGVMGKIINAQSIVVASTATGWYGQEGRILRHVFWHSISLAALMGLLVLLQAYVYPFTAMVSK